MQDYLKVLGIQMELSLESDHQYEYLIESDEYKKQMTASLQLIDKLDPDLIIYPEMSYNPSYDEPFKKISKRRIIVAGSIYREKTNTTIVYQDGNRIEIPKKYASGAEPMIRYMDFMDPIAFLKEHLEEHIFILNGRKIVVLNCMEYYHLAYYIARTEENLFALVSPCSTNNTKVFKEETKALHNHNENIYSFIVNCISTYNGEPYAKGESYIYGPIQHHEQQWLKESGVQVDLHNSSILELPQQASYFYGEFKNNLVPYGRSDSYFNNPKNVIVKRLEKER